jgi:hypothetical protein
MVKLVVNQITGKLQKFPDNLTDIDNRAHSSLTSLASDDHAQYVLLAGRAGGQSLNGGTAASEDLTIYASADTSKGKVDIVKGTQVTAPAGTSTADALRVVHHTGINSVSRAGMFITHDTDNNANTATCAGFNAFIYKDGTGANTGSTGYVVGRYGFRMTPAATAGNITNANVLYTEFDPHANYTGTITNARGLYMRAFSDGGGAITNAYHLYLDPQTAGATRNVSIALAGDSTGIGVANLGAGIAFGTDLDAGITYNGTDMIINPQNVGTGFVKLISQSATPEYLLSLYNSSAQATGNRIKFFHSRGTLASPTVTQSGDTLGGFCFYGYTNAEKECAGIYANAKSLWTASSAESYLSFWNTANSSVVNTERGRWTSTGLSLGAFYANQRLHSAYNDQWVMDMTVPTAPTGTPATSGGSMADGTYYYVLTAVDRFGGETIKGTESAAITITGGSGNGSVALTWTTLVQAYKYKLYRTTVSGTYTTPALIATLPSNAEFSYIDTASAASTGAPPATTTAYSVKLHSGNNSISQLNSSTISLSPLVEITRPSAYEVDLQKISQMTLFNVGGNISGGTYSSSYDRFYGTRPGSADPLSFAGNKHQNITLPGYPAPVVAASESGGSIGAGTYYYTIVQTTNYISATVPETTVKSVESAAATIVGSTGSVLITLPNVVFSSNTKQFDIYRTTVAGTYSGTNYIATVTAGTLTYTDTLASPSAGTPAATTVSQYPYFGTYLRTEGGAAGAVGGAALITYVDRYGNYIHGSTTNVFKTNTATNTIAIKSGTAPSANPATDHSYIYSADQAAGNNRIFVMTEGTTDPMIIGKGYLYGSNAANGDLYLEATNNSTRTTSTIYLGQAGGTTQIGDATNYTEFLSDGTLVLHGTARVTEQEKFHATSAVKGVSAPTDLLVAIGASGGVMVPTLSFSKTSQQDIYFEFHAPYSCDFTAPVNFHVVWHPGSGWTTGNYVWKLEYLVKNENDLLATGTPTTISMDVTPADNTHFIETEFTSNITLTNDDQLLVCHFYRDVASDTADDVGNVCIFEMNYTKNKQGANV